MRADIDPPAVTLCEYDIEEWWDVCRNVRPDVSRELFERWWREFLELKRRRALH